MRFRDARLTVFKGALYQGYEWPTPPEGLPEATPRRLSRFIGKTRDRRRESLPLDFPEPAPNRASRRSNGQRRPRRRLRPLPSIDLPWRHDS